MEMTLNDASTNSKRAVTLNNLWTDWNINTPTYTRENKKKKRRHEERWLRGIFLNPGYGEKPLFLHRHLMEQRRKMFILNSSDPFVSNSISLRKSVLRYMYIHAHRFCATCISTLIHSSKKIKITNKNIYQASWAA